MFTTDFIAMIGRIPNLTVKPEYLLLRASEGDRQRK